MKTYYPGETKGERKARKLQEKLDLAKERLNPTPMGTKQNYVVCLKFGAKYGPEYVNNLYNMVKRNCTLNYEFVCFTERPDGIDPGVRIEPLPKIGGMGGAVGWWYKPMFFDKALPLRGTILYLDLDLIVFRNIDHLFTHKPGEFLICRDFNRFVIKNYPKFNSSVFRLDSGQHPQVWKDFARNPTEPIRRWHGDQDWIRHKITQDFDYWPDEWIQSYKWEMRGKPRMVGTKGNRDFETPGEPKILNETSIAVFHGDPNPHYCKDLWVRENWK